MIVTLAQMNPVVGDIDGNVGKIIELTQRASDKHEVGIIVFPELVLSGYPPEDLLYREDFLRHIDAGLDRLRDQAANVYLLVGHPARDGDHLYNACSIIHRRQTVAVYYKRNLPNYSVFDEKRYFTPGRKPLIINIGDVAVAISICEDIWSPEPGRESAAQGAQLLINLNASPFHTGKHAQRLRILKDRIRETQLAVVYLNMVGGQDELVFDGGSLVMDRNASVVLQAPFFTEHLHSIGIENRSGNLIFTGGNVPESFPELEQTIYDALVLGIRDYVAKNNFGGAVLGLSGGIDSALTLCLAVDALGPENVETLIMPSRFTAPMSIEDAEVLARNLGVVTRNIPIESTVAAFEKLLAPLFSGLPRDATEENIQARCRGILLMAISNKTGKLVLATGNKSEMAVGYATLYGDMAGGFAPLKDVSKLMVYRLCKWRNARTADIPRRIIDRPPSAELRPEQKDEDSLPCYDILDQILDRYIELDQAGEEIIAQGFDSTTVHDVIRMVDRNEYKRRQAAPGVKISQRAFGRDRRYPITSRYGVE